MQIQSAEGYWPTSGWKECNPSVQDLRPLIINQITNYIENFNTQHLSSKVDSCIVVKNGFIVYEDYFNLYTQSNFHPLWSVTKSVISSLIGIAIKEGFIDGVNEHILNFFPGRNISNLDYRKESITIEHLLLMSTGLAYPGDDEIWSGWMNSPNQVQYILNLPMATIPGTIFNYDTGGSHLLSAIIQYVTNRTTEEFAEEYLFGPLGITHYFWMTDKQGINFGGHGLHLEPRDMAKFAYLYLQDGIWENERILPEGWVEYSTDTYWNFNVLWGYSHQWWTHPFYNAYAAAGRYGQRIIVIPEDNLIVVFTASLSVSEPEPYFEILNNFILSAFDYPKVFLAYTVFFPLVGVSLFVIIISSVKRLKIK